MRIGKVKQITACFYAVMLILLVLALVERAKGLLLPAIVVGVASGIFKYRFWRCPHCNAFLGEGSPTKCPECGEALEY